MRNAANRAVIQVGGMSKPLALPETIKDSDLQIAKKDCELLAEAIEQNPKLWQALNEAIAASDFEAATRLVIGAGLSEQDIKAKGGGFIWIIVIVILLYATKVY